MTLNQLISLIFGFDTYSTYFGRVWLLVYLYQVVVCIISAQYVWIINFECNTRQPGCTKVCYDLFFPISPSLLWALQLVAITCTSLLVRCWYQGRIQKKRRNTSSHRGADLNAKTFPDTLRLVCLSLLLRGALDVGCLYIFYYIYHSCNVPGLYECDMPPCPNKVNCYISRPTAKKISLLFMVVSTCVCIVMSVCEMVYLIYQKIHRQCKKSRQRMFPERHELGELVLPRTDPTASRALSRASSRTSVQNPHSLTASEAQRPFV
ncbi:gap junction beta-7 protein-like [Alosa sapidissima]|uniref:gap junction beta-7 protein-like n=1 Tax=Alosa sapidissima TaxID=34773 RepID=UPI001C083A35|nr:gap junction beta-7 protein-like [Alosa sapidissima]